MKISIYTKLSFNIVAIFVVVILMSLVPDQFPDFFGDWHCAGKAWGKETESYIGCDYGGAWPHLPAWHWGYQHWLWFLMGICLFIVQIARISTIIADNNKK